MYAYTHTRTPPLSLSLSAVSLCFFSFLHIQETFDTWKSVDLLKLISFILNCLCILISLYFLILLPGWYTYLLFMTLWKDFVSSSILSDDFIQMSVFVKHFDSSETVNVSILKLDINKRDSVPSLVLVIKAFDIFCEQKLKSNIKNIQIITQ
jgi:hypothetical protein